MSVRNLKRGRWASAILVVAACGLPTAAAAQARYYRVDQLDASHASVSVWERQPSERIELANLKVRDGARIEARIFASRDDLKTELLSTGLVCLDDLSKATAQEVEVQRRAGVCAATLAPPPAAPDAVTPKAAEPKKPGFIERFAGLLWRNWEKIFGLGVIVGTIAIARWVIKASRSAMRRKAVDLVIAGVPAAGKTALKTRLLDPDVDPRVIDALESSSTVRPEKLKGSVSGGIYEFFPRLTDIPGTFEGRVIDEFVTAKTFASFGETKKVLVIVLAPDGIQKQKLQTASEPYLKSQHGWLILVRALLQSQRLKKPDVIAIFINKSDLYGVSGSDLEEKVRSEFAEITDAILKAAKEANVPTVSVIGSARLGTNTGDLFQKITRKLSAAQK